VLGIVLLASSAFCYVHKELKLLRLLFAPACALLVIAACIHAAVLDVSWYIYVAAFLGFFLAESIVVMSVCGPPARFPRAQYVATGVGMVAPLFVVVVGIFWPHWISYQIGLFASIVASSVNLLFNKASQ
jgi:hypothetical protein